MHCQLPISKTWSASLDRPEHFSLHSWRAQVAEMPSSNYFSKCAVNYRGTNMPFVLTSIFFDIVLSSIIWRLSQHCRLLLTWLHLRMIYTMILGNIWNWVFPRIGLYSDFYSRHPCRIEREFETTKGRVNQWHLSCLPEEKVVECPLGGVTGRNGQNV